MPNGSASHSTARVGLVIITAALSLAFITGCARSRRANDRAKVLEAENINLRQRSTTMQEQMRMAHASNDEMLAQQQQMRQDMMAAREQAAGAAAARDQAMAAEATLSDTQNALEQREADLAAAQQRIAALEAQKRRPAPVRRPSVRPATLRPGVGSPEIEAMRRDLQQHLASYGVRGLNVEVRTDRTGRQRVAVVLPDAFPSGKATLAYNVSAVKAVISVGKMIQAQYPESSVVVEGHTDSDPIRKSKWGTNENLSLARAQAVQDLLTGSGVKTAQVTTVGLGARQPLAAGSTKRAKSKNRRVEIFISPRA